MVTDHLSDMLARVKNGYRAKADVVSMPTTKTVAEVLRVLSEEGYVGPVEKVGENIEVTLKYRKGKEPALMGAKMVSKPGVRIYSKSGNMPRVWGGLGINIITTPKGILSGKKAKKLKAGGEIICQVW